MKNHYLICRALSVISCMLCIGVNGVIPNSMHQYAADGEYSDLLSISSWVAGKVGNPSIKFMYPKCLEIQQVDRKYADSMLFNGVVKWAGGTVVGGLVIATFNNTPAFKQEMNKILNATDEEAASPSFVNSVASLAGRKDVLETGISKVGGMRAFFSTTRMVRRVGGEVVYRGIQRVYLIPQKDGKRIVSVNYCIGALGVNEYPYSDFEAFMPIGDKFIRSISISEKSNWKFW